MRERQGDPADRRRRLVWLSPAGREHLERDRDVLSVELLERAFDVMPAGDRLALMDAVDALLRADDVWPAGPGQTFPPITNTPDNERKPL